MANITSLRGSKNSPAWPPGLTPGPAAAVRSVRMVLVLTAASLTAGCGGGGATTSAVTDKPGWSLADKPPVALGGPSGAAALPGAGRDYVYRGGRDPVTGTVQSTASEAVARSGVVAAGPRVIEIRKGDTLHGLSLIHHVSVKALMAANKLTSATIKPGQKLVVPQG